MYSKQLQWLDCCKRPQTLAIPAILARINTPLHIQHWQSSLESLPDQHLADYVFRGISEGFRIGYNFAHKMGKPAIANLPSTLANPEVVDSYIEEEMLHGRIVGPVPEELRNSIHTSPFGVIPKGHGTGKWRLIVDLSSPRGHSVNDGIDPAWCSLTYISVDDVAQMIASMGRGTLLAKMDLKSAYRMIPVHPEDRWLLGMKWRDQTYVDTCLPFGLRSAPLIFTAVADALEMIVRQRGIQWIWHYLDDFITMGAPGAQECEHNRQTFLQTCDYLGVMVAQEKCMGPSTCLTFLGIEIDTIKMELRLPEDKLVRVREVVTNWLGRKAGRRREIESLLGLLQHAAKVVRPGRRFTRRIIQVMTSVQDRDRFVRLNAEIRSDLCWWHEFLETWNGVGILQNDEMDTVSLYTDASGNWGCGAIWGTKWLQWKWNKKAQQWHIAPKELLPIVAACLVWGKQWAGKRVQCYCDNMAVVEVLNNGYSRDKDMMHLLRSLFFITEYNSIVLQAIHIAGSTNVAADAVSRNDMARFSQVQTGAAASPSQVPSQVWSLLVEEQPDWISPSWRTLFTTCIRQV